MNREVHIRFCERRGVRFPSATHPTYAAGNRRDSDAGADVVVVISSLHGGGASGLDVDTPTLRHWRHRARRKDRAAPRADHGRGPRSRRAGGAIRIRWSVLRSDPQRSEMCGHRPCSGLHLRQRSEFAVTGWPSSAGSRVAAGHGFATDGPGSPLAMDWVVLRPP